MPPTSRSKRLGKLVRDRREDRGLSLRQVAEHVEGTDAPYLLRLERGEYLQPHPSILQGLSRTLEIPLTELYTLAGYPMPHGLPSLPVFLRTTMDLPERKIAEIEAYIQSVQDATTPKRSPKRGGRDGKSDR